MTRTSFINVDLELSSVESLASLAEELSEKIFILKNEFFESEYQLAFECTLNASEASSVFDTFLKLVDSLSKISKEKLSRCHGRVLDIGYESGEEGFVANMLSSNMLGQVAGYGFSINITVYPLDKTSLK